MPHAGYIDPRPLEYFMIHEAEPAGGRLGFYGKQAIFETIVDAFGQRYRYAGVMPRRWDGEFDIAALQTGEFILLPGLVYRIQPPLKPTWFSSLLRTHRAQPMSSSNERPPQHDT